MIQAGRTSSAISKSLSSDLETLVANQADLLPLHASRFRSRLQVSPGMAVTKGYISQSNRMIGPLDVLLVTTDHAGNEAFAQDVSLVSSVSVNLGLWWAPDFVSLDWLIELFVLADNIRAEQKGSQPLALGWVQSEENAISILEIRQWMTAAGLDSIDLVCEEPTGAPQIWIFDFAPESGWKVCGMSKEELLKRLKSSYNPDTSWPFAQASGTRKAEHKNLEGHTALHLAVTTGKVDEIRQLLTRGADPNARDYEFYSPLHLAAENNLAEGAALLLEYGAQWQARNHKRKTPLHQAAEAGAIEVAQVLLESGADPNAPMQKGITPLHLASWNGHADMIELLIRYQADISMVNEDGNTCLHFAAGNGEIKILKLLISFGAQPEVYNKRGLTYLEVVNEGYSGEPIPVMQ